MEQRQMKLVKEKLGAEAVRDLALAESSPPLSGFAYWRNSKKQWNKNAVRLRSISLFFLLANSMVLCGCDDLVPRDTSSLLSPHLHRSEIIGFLAGFGTTFAALPDLLSMLKRRSSAGMNPRMAAIMGVFQLLWVYYGVLIASRPIIAWNLLAILINFVSVGAFRHFARKEAAARGSA